jgi:23S rRNA (cytosine1962-C5)-methyltransferase
VLNLFAYTCAFSVAAIAQGARQVVNNDMSRPALQLGERNHVLNGNELRRVRMVPHNLFKSWWKIRQLGPYDVVIIDPPTNQRGSFVAEKSYGQILKRLGEFTSPGGRVVACLNSPFLGPDFLNNQMARWCPQARLEKTYAPHPDFPERFAERGLKVLEFGYPGNRQGGPDR